MIIVIQCKDRVGLVAAISGLMEQEQINIISMREHVDTEQNLFFARIELQGSPDAKQLKQKLIGLLPVDSFVTVNPSPTKKLIVLVTKEYHCLTDILIRNHFKTLGAEVKCVIGNHNILEDICTKLGVPFYYITHENKSIEQFEQEIKERILSYNMDYLVLAKFMRILSPSFIESFENKIINIHHSFLPAFIGANPYRQAHERGVKIIGATAHFVTNSLDEGPIIVQQIIPIDHTVKVADMKRAGKEIEKATLSKAIQLVTEDRVFVYKNKTVVFD